MLKKSQKHLFIKPIGNFGSHIVILTFLTSLLVYNQSIKQEIAYFMVIGVLSLFPILFSTNYKIKREICFFFKKSKPIIFAFLLYWLIMVINIRYVTSLINVVFIFGYLYSFFICFFFLCPVIQGASIDIKRFFVFLGLFLTFIALAGYITGEINFGVFKIQTFRIYQRATFYLPGFNSIFNNQNTFGSLILICLFSAVFIYFTKKGFFNAYLIICIFLFFALVFSCARSSYVGFAVSLFFLPLVSKYSRKKYVIIFFISFIIAISMVALNDKIILLGQDFMQLDKTYTRSYLTKASLNAIMAKPLFGYGQSDFPPLLQSFSSIDLHNMGPHNTFLKTLLSSGIIGFVSYLLIILISLRRAFYMSKRGSITSQWLFCLICGMIVHFYFEVRSLGGLGTIPLTFSFFLGWVNYIYLKFIQANKCRS